MTIHLTQGDLLAREDVDAIVNTVNCVGVMGKGIALQFKNKWPANFKAYKAACESGEIRLGSMFVFDSGGLLKPNFIINFPTKNHWRGKSDLESIRIGLKDLVRVIRRHQIRSVAVPPLGCGNGGLDWNQVRPIIEAAFNEIPTVQAFLFAPGSDIDPKAMIVNTNRPRMTAARAAMLKVMEIYRRFEFGLSKIEVQKLAYFLQLAGENMKLNFSKHSFGPYSEELKHALNRMEGHFIRGLGDGVVHAEIEPVEQALAEADEYIDTLGDPALRDRVSKVADLIDGFESPYGMELLASVHWVATHDPNVSNPQSALLAIGAWSDRKKSLMTSAQVEMAWARLNDLHWFNQTMSTNSPTANHAGAQH
jgi:O-acetyl-ADP-ribose deacetylase (regulator of RNase III)